MAAGTNISYDDDSFTPRSFHGPIPQAPDRVASTVTAPDYEIYFWDQLWRNEAACIDLPSDIFFPERGMLGENIRDICFSCPVRLDCLDYSVYSMPKFGWFGGHPESGRKKVRRLMRNGYDLETADAVVLGEALSKIRNLPSRRSDAGKKKAKPNLISVAS